MNWKDIETGHDAYGNPVFDWAKLEEQMDLAVFNGKMFTLDFRSGIYGMPDHELTSFPGTPGLVTPLTFDTSLKDNQNDHVPPNCGTPKPLASPADQHYRDAYEDFATHVIQHVRSNTAW